MSVKNNNTTPKRITIKDIARELDISTGSVDRALNNRGRIKNETKNMILEKAAELGYKPNKVASKLSMRKKHRIMLIMPEEPKYFWNDVRLGMAAAISELEDFGVEVIKIFIKSNGETRVDNIIKSIEENRINAVVMSPVGLENAEKIPQYIVKNNIPFATFNEDITPQKRLFYYGPDKELSGKIAGELIGKFLSGRGDVCIIINSNQTHTQTERVKMFNEEINRYYPGITVVKSYNYLPEMKQKNISNVIKIAIDENVNLKGIYLGNAVTSDEFGNAMIKSGRKDIVIVGHERSTCSSKLLKEGYIDALICEDKICQGYYPLKIMYEYLISGNLPEADKIFSNTNVALRNNINCIEGSNKNYLAAYDALPSGER